MKMLAYGITADVFDKFLDIAESTAIEIFGALHKSNLECVLSAIPPPINTANLRRLLDKAEERGFMGMVGSLNCMH